MNIKQWIPVESSNVSQIGFDDDNGIIGVVFKNGSVYAYHGCDAAEFAEFKDADSKGRYINQHLKGWKRYTQVA